ncbi:uncharacterized protein LOC121281412 [Carcharodon carcharias]|uniref:uncharacterized protein LOC121281412 n=1 Tax=Carcharodon carcharias TaxID=13397 RepID=UPI001B7E31C6|nr:uncharacterized protein LOC121281412 [Carcharodon carcharias]
MSLRFFCRKLPAGSMFGFFVFLLPPVFTQSNPIQIYFLDEGDDVSLKGPDDPGDGPVVWEWKPHSGQEAQQLVTFHKSSQWDGEWNEHFINSELYQNIEKNRGGINLRIRNPTFNFSGSFILTQTQPTHKILLKWYEVSGIKDLLWKSYTLYRSETFHSELRLICYYYHNVAHSYEYAEWFWKSHLQNLEIKIAFARKPQLIKVGSIYFENRLVPTVTTFNGVNFNMRIAPILFEDAGVYRCMLGTYKYVTITLITVKVTAEPSDAVIEGDTVTLTCSVSDVTETMRLVWINSDGKSVVEKTLKEQRQEQGLLQLIIQNADRDRRNWTCVLFHQNIPKVLISHYLKVNRNSNHVYFLDEGDDISLYGPDNPGDGPVVWKWKPHSGQEIQQLVTFHKMWLGWWDAEWSKQFRYNDLYQKIEQEPGSINLRIRNPEIKFSGLFILTQTQPGHKILKCYEVFGIKVEASPQRPLVGSDINLSCTISRLSDTVSLHWKQRGPSQQNRRKTDQIRLNNTAYLIVKHVTVEDGKLYECEVKENGSIVITGNADFPVDKNIFEKNYTLYRSGTGHSELYLICYDYYDNSLPSHNTAAWSWRSQHLQNHEKEIASASKSQPIDVNRNHFGNRLVPTETNFNGANFSVRIFPVLFEDAGVYTCSPGPYKMETIKLITVKVTAEPSDAVTEGDTVTLTCSVSDVTESMRLVWIDSDGKTVVEKTLNRQNRKEKSLKLIVQKAERGRGKWICVLFHQNKPQVSAPYYLEPSGSWNDIYFFHQEGSFVLKGPDNPGNGSIVWEWRPHSGQQTTKQFGTFHRQDQRWAVQWSDGYNNIPDISQRIREDWGTLNLRIRNLPFELAGLFTWSQTQPSKKILKQYEVIGIKVETDSQMPVMGSDITLSCTISRLSDTVNLHWKQRGSSQQNGRKNTDEIHLNNTVYLIVRHVGAGNQNLYTWEVQENNSIVLTGNTNVDVDWDLHNKKYTLYRSSTDHSELDLICEAHSESTKTKWTWSSRYFQNQDKEIASAYKSQSIDLNRTYFGKRLAPTKTNFNGKNFSVRIVPVLFEDAGVYTCISGKYKMVTIKLITVKVTAEPSDAVTEGDTITLTCSVSEATESMRIVWISSDGKTVVEKTLKEEKQEQGLLQLIIQNADQDRRNWTCVLFHQNTPKILIPYYLKVNGDYIFKRTNVVIFVSLALLLIIILAVVLYLRRFKFPGLENQRQKKSPQPGENIEGAEGEAIHYGSVVFQKKAPGSEVKHCNFFVFFVIFVFFKTRNVGVGNMIPVVDEVSKKNAKVACPFCLPANCNIGQAEKHLSSLIV